MGTEAVDGMDGINDARLAAFLAVADAGGISAAARAMHVSQPALSRAVMELERRLGARLFDRVRGGVALTEEGRELRTIAQEILRARRDGLARFQAFLSRGHETLVIAALPSLTASYLPRIVSRYRVANRSVTVRIHDGTRDWIEHAVRSGAADLGLTGGAESTGPAGDDLLGGELAAEQIGRDGFHAVLRPDDELCGQDVVSWRQLAERPFVALSEDSSIRPLTDAAFRQARVTARQAFETSQVVSVAGFVAAGLGVSALPELTLPLVRFAEVVARPLVAPTMSRRLFLLRRGPVPAAGPVHDFREMLLTKRATPFAAGPGLPI